MQMSSTPSEINDADFNKHLKSSIKYMGQQNFFGFLPNLHSTIIPPEVPFIDPVQYNTVMAFADSCAAYKVIKEKMSYNLLDYNKERTVKPTKTELDAQERLVQIYSLYVATSIGMKKLANTTNVQEEATIKLKKEDFKHFNEFDFSKQGSDMFNQFANHYIGLILNANKAGKIRNGADFNVFSQGYLASINEKANYEKNDGIYKPLMGIIEGQPISLLGMNFRGFQEALLRTLDPESLPKLEWVIAMDAVKEAAVQMVDNIMCYDFEAKKNSQDPCRQVMYVPGPSGCGKTFTAEAVQRYFIEQGEQYRKPTNVFTLSPDMFKTSYMNEGPNNLIAIFRDKVYTPNTLNFMYIPDLDTIIASRSAAKAANRIEDANLTGVWFSQLSGSNRPDTGRWMIYADTNYQVNDPALLGRLGQPIIASGPKTQDDLIALMRIELKDGFLPNKNYVKLKDKEWKEVGKLAEEYAAEANLSGRDVRNICETLSNHANQFKLPKGFQGWSYQKQLDHKAKHQVYKPITAGMLKKELNTYVESVKAAVDREQEEKKAKIIEDLHLTREAYASDEESRISLFRELAAQIPKDQMVSIIRKVI